MKKQFIALMLVCFCFYSCASARFIFAFPKTDPSIYIEKPLSEVIAGNLTGEEAYEKEYGGRSKYHIISEAYLRCNNETDWIIYYDNEANSLNVYFSDNFRREFNILENEDYDFRKLYKIKYTLEWAGPGSDTTNKRVFYIKIDSIEGMLTYREYENKEAERQRAEREVKKLQRKNSVETAYADALKTAGTDAIAEFIKKYGHNGEYRGEYRDFFIEDSYAEIARRIVNDRNIKFDNITMKGNPYAYEKDTIYFYRYSINIHQWMTNGILCYIDDHALIIEKIPDVKKLGKFIKNAYLNYTGTRTLQFVNGKTEVIPVFNLIYTIDIDKTLYEESTVNDAFAWALHANEDTTKKFKAVAVFYQNTGGFLIFTDLNREHLCQFDKTYTSLDSAMKGQIVTLYFTMQGYKGEHYGPTITWYRGEIDDFIYQ
jgi:hypothetical protein